MLIKRSNVTDDSHNYVEFLLSRNQINWGSTYNIFSVHIILTLRMRRSDDACGDSVVSHDPFFSEFKYCSRLKTGLRLRKIINYVRNITPISKSKGKKTNCLSQFVQHFFRVFHLNFRMKQSVRWWSITRRRFMIPSRNLNIVLSRNLNILMPLTRNVQAHFSEP